MYAAPASPPGAAPTGGGCRGNVFQRAGCYLGRGVRWVGRNTTVQLGGPGQPGGTWDPNSGWSGGGDPLQYTGGAQVGGKNMLLIVAAVAVIAVLLLRR